MPEGMFSFLLFFFFFFFVFFCFVFFFLHLSTSCGIMSSKILTNDKILIMTLLILLFLDGDITGSHSYGIYIPQRNRLQGYLLM